MTERPRSFDGEIRQTDALAPENENAEQRDRDTQAQTVAAQAIERSTSVLGLKDSEKLESSFSQASAQDLVDHMRQMERGNTIDMSAYRGEPNHDDNTDKYGDAARVDQLRGDGT